MHAPGTHILIDLWGIGPEHLDDVSALEACLVEAARSGGARVVESRFHRFEPHGISGIVVLAESHLAIHTWPELELAAADVFTCGDGAVADAIVRRLIAALKPTEHRIRRLDRGTGLRQTRKAG